MSAIRPGLSIRGTETNFRHMESFIAQIVNRFPLPTVFMVTRGTPGTFVMNIRDSITAFLHPDCVWESSEVDKMALARCRPQFGFQIELPNKVICTPIDKSIRRTNAIVIKTEDGRMVDGSDEDAVKAIFLLKSRGIMAEPVIFSTLDESLVSWAGMEYPGVLLEPEPDGSWMAL